LAASFLFLYQSRDVAYWHIADIRGTATICPLLDKSGQQWIFARDGLSAFDPTATIGWINGWPRLCAISHSPPGLRLLYFKDRAALAEPA
jgi:hypothetical protein